MFGRILHRNHLGLEISFLEDSSSAFNLLNNYSFHLIYFRVNEWWYFALLKELVNFIQVATFFCVELFVVFPYSSCHVCRW